MIYIYYFINKNNLIKDKQVLTARQNKKYYSMFIQKQFNFKHKPNNFIKIIKRFTGVNPGKKLIEEMTKTIKNIRPVSPPRIPNQNQNITQTHLRLTPQAPKKISNKKYHYDYKYSVSNSLGSTIYSTNNPNVGLSISPLINLALPEGLNVVKRRYNKPLDFASLENSNELLLSPVFTLSSTSIKENQIMVNVTNVKPISQNNILSNLSGLMSLDQNFRLKLQDNQALNEFSTFFLHILSKIIYTLFFQPFNKETSVLRIFKCFYSIQNDLSSLNDFSRKLFMDKYISTIQHILTILCHDLTIDPINFYTILKTIDPKFFTYFNIDLSHYNKIPANVIIEFCVFHQNVRMLNYNMMPRNVQLIDHMHPMFHKVAIDDVAGLEKKQEDIKSNIFKESESLTQTSQVHCDLLFYNIEVDSEAVTKIKDKMYRDVKASFHGSNKGHFTLIPSLFSDNNIAVNYMDKYIGLIGIKIKQIKNDSVFLSKYFKDLTKIRDKCALELNASNLQKMVLNFNQMLLQMTFNSTDIKLNFNFTLASDMNIDEYYIKYILPMIKQNLENNQDLVDINIFFPTNKKINIIEYNKKIVEIIHKLIPEAMRERILDNYNKYIENHDK